MKMLPAIVSLATIATLLLLAVAASVTDFIPFALVASYVVGFGCSIGFLALFIADYTPRSRRLVETVVSEAEAERELEAMARAAAAQRRFREELDQLAHGPLTANMLRTLGLRNDQATLSLS
jgi:hypothetical protein